MRSPSRQGGGQVRSARMQLALGAMLGLACSGSAQKPPIDRGDEAFRVRFHPAALKLALAMRLADESWAAVERLTPVLQQAGCLPDEQVTIEVYADVDAFRDVEQQHPQGVFLVESLCTDDGAAHVAVWPPLTEESLRLVGLPDTTAYAIIEQAARAVARRSEVGRGDAWLCDVLACGMLDACVNPKFVANVDPLFDGRHEVLALGARTGAVVHLRELVEHDLEVNSRYGRDVRLEHASWAARMLAQNNPAWPDLVLHKRGEAKQAVGTVAVRLAIFESVLGGDWARTDDELDELVRAVQPLWTPHIPLVAARDGRLLLAGRKDLLAQTTYQLELPDGPYVLKARVRVEPTKWRSVRVVFDWDGETALGALLFDRECQLAVFRGKDWEDVQKAEWQMPDGKWFELELEVGDQVRLLLDGEQVLAATYPDRDLHGVLSVATNHAVVWLENLRVEPVEQDGR